LNTNNKMAAGWLTNITISRRPVISRSQLVECECLHWATDP